MKRLRITTLFLIVIFLALVAGSCASNRSPVRHYKPKRPGGCDCSRWSYHQPSNPNLFYAGEENASGRA
ncbi:MAG TPA: hypothetical protein PLW31_04160 [Bacteroidales bacterium]|nr:hypothetical protein [Bacteroidales bacterium]HPI84872.1 hypothetical protein [Bacteroidales bacterium]HPM92533.1 hypothetical protein [Bacteroidales bacterium]